MRKRAYKRIICNCGVCKNCQIQKSTRNAVKRSGLKSLDRFYDEDFLSDQIDLLDDSFLDLVDDESDGDSADDIPLFLIYDTLRRIAPFVKIFGPTAKTFVRRVHYFYSQEKMPLQQAVRAAVKELKDAGGSQPDSFSNDYNELSDSFYGLLNEGNLLVQDFSYFDNSFDFVDEKYIPNSYKKDPDYQGETKLVSLSQGSKEIIKKAKELGAERSGIYIIFRNKKPVYVGMAKERKNSKGRFTSGMHLRVATHHRCLSKFDFSPSTIKQFKVKAFFFKVERKGQLELLESAYREKWSALLKHTRFDALDALDEYVDLTDFFEEEDDIDLGSKSRKKFPRKKTKKNQSHSISQEESDRLKELCRQLVDATQHKNNSRKSTIGKHQKGHARKVRDCHRRAKNSIMHNGKSYEDVVDDLVRRIRQAQK